MVRGEMLPDRIGRFHFLLWLVAAFLVIPVTYGIAYGSLRGHLEFLAPWLVGIVLIVWFYIYLGCLAPARMRDIGWNPLLTLLLLIPLVNLGMLILLLLKPSNSGRPPHV